MSQAYFITQKGLLELVDSLLQAGTQVVAPAQSHLGTRARIEYRELQKSGEMLLGSPLPRRSLKEFFLPPTEPLFRWKETKAGVTLDEVPVKFASRVVLGSYPCDAAAVEAVDKVMDWDFHDELWFGRREATTIISQACNGGDATCFCAAAGLAPDSSKGSDALIIPEGDGWRLETVTPKGEAFLKAHAAHFKPASANDGTQAFRQAALKKVQSNVEMDLPGVTKWLDLHFEHDFWAQVARNCHGCGACASLCPTCHCFDIVDEPDGLGTGVRRRNWDTCQSAKFTLHGSGHNPRPMQTNRMRQRIMHKFNIYPTRFGVLLCSGCGRCARGCGGGMNLPETLAALSALAKSSNTPGGAA